jgi:hypothetical protein
MPRIATSIVVAGAACFVFAAYALVVLNAVTLVCTENLKSDYSGDEVRQGWRVNE